MSEKVPVIYSVKVDDFEFNFTREQVDAIDLVEKSPQVFHMLKDCRSVNAVLIASDASAKHQTIAIDGKWFEVQIKDELDQVLDKMGFSTVASRQIKEIKAPMPGLVLEIAVVEGQQVKQGDKILILVAMKMENGITINTDAAIKRITVKAGEAVEKGQVLVELE